ncbi:serine hydrolase domain-containing protein [Kordiimonas laminariae]|uniref:serine hydrolase domain-containing protein n=1 Tax=Kordiimonas laminariae TaxID=2917717 RepID=UPI001FF332C6|nr:serine hydrolase domain-containing protein [Kordiimonas laminariae]MCK0069667.1 beta-lactamase family protein [Kordiimonas laminariae]
MRYVLGGLVAAISAFVIMAFIVANAVFGWTRTAIAPSGDAHAFVSAASEYMNTENRGNAVMMLLEDGAIVGEYSVAKGEKVDRHTHFQLASLSKWVSAWGVMTLVEAGKLDLDAPVARYLSRWSLPSSDFDHDKVTIRRLLSHTAGLTDGLGYSGFSADEAIQSLEESLTQARDKPDYTDGRVRVGIEPGTMYNYSGGGFTLLQLVIEEVSGQSFNSYMREKVLIPLGMEHSTYVLSEDNDNLAQFFDENGQIAPHYRYTALAAASLYAPALDIARFLQAHAVGPNGEPVGRNILSPETLEIMRMPMGYSLGFEVYGVGVGLYGTDKAGEYVIGHDGSNRPAIGTTARINPSTGDGIIILATGHRNLATKIAGEWGVWKTGKPDIGLIFNEILGTIKLALVIGLIVFISILILWLRRPVKKVSS